MKPKITARQIAAIVFGVVIASGIANYDKLLPHRWHTYAAPDGSFSIELPDKPTVKTTQVPVEGAGTPTVSMITAEPTSSTAYTCSYFDDASIGKKTPSEALQSARDGSLAKIQGTELSQNQTTLQGYPALEWQARARGDSLVDSRMILVGDRLYIIMAVATAKQDREPKTLQRMFDSFKLTKN